MKAQLGHVITGNRRAASPQVRVVTTASACTQGTGRSGR